MADQRDQQPGGGHAKCGGVDGHADGRWGRAISLRQGGEQRLGGKQVDKGQKPNQPDD